MKNNHHIALTAIPIGPVRNQTPQLIAAKKRLQTCQGRTECSAAIREYLAAKHHAAQADTTPTAIPLCSVCGAHALLARHERTSGVCNWCAPTTNGHQPPNSDKDTA
jgi:hypothetical protein